MTVTPDNAEAGPSTGPHHMRITSGGSINNYVKFALDFLDNNSSRPVILHTRPPSPAPKPPTNQPRSNSTLQPCTLNVPRLISVVELIKREFIAELEKSKKGKGKHRAIGIWQYTRSGLIEPKDLGLGLEAEGDVAGMGLERVLQGKLKPKMTHYPYLEVTLSARPLGLEKERDTSCQYTLAARPRPTKRKSGKNVTELNMTVEDKAAEQGVARVDDTAVPAAAEKQLGDVQGIEGPIAKVMPEGQKKSNGKKRKVTSLGSGQNRITKKVKAAG